MSLPPLVRWDYDVAGDPAGSPREAELPGAPPPDRLAQAYELAPNLITMVAALARRCGVVRAAAITRLRVRGGCYGYPYGGRTGLVATP